MPHRVLGSVAASFGTFSVGRRPRIVGCVIATLAGAFGTFLQKRGEETKDKR